MKNKKIKIGISIVILVLLAIFLLGKFDKKKSYSATNYYLDTVNEVTLINIKEKKAQEVLKGVDKIILDINNEMSSHMQSSEISEVNRMAGIEPVKVNSDIFTVLEKAVYYSKLTNGGFDVTVGPLTMLWNIGSDKARLPSKAEIDHVLPLINYKDIILNEKDQSVFLKRKGMIIDLGGIAKGYCADKVADYLKKENVKDAIINLGGNVYVLGQNKKGKDFVVGVRNPHNPTSGKEDKPMGSIVATDKSIVTSGVYERFLKANGEIYHHMLNPHTGYPFKNNLSSVSIVSDKSIDGDALSTSIFGLGLEKGLKEVESLKDIEAIFITNDDKVYISSGLQDNFNIIDDDYKLMN